MTTSEKIKPEQSVLVEVRADAVWITLNRPTALNAITPDMVAGITAALTHADDPAIKAVVLMGTGRAFCAGADLKYVNSATQGDAPAATRFLDAVLDMMARLETCPRPVIAAVNGLALAGGLELVLCCDLVIAARSAKLGDAHANFTSLFWIKVMIRIGATLPFQPRFARAFCVQIAFNLEAHIAGEYLRFFTDQKVMIGVFQHCFGDQ